MSKRRPESDSVRFLMRNSILIGYTAGIVTVVLILQLVELVK